MAILVSGSIAYDYIMSFPGTFKEHILPDSIHILNVSFVVDQLEKDYGGVAGNITYTMGVLGAEPILLGTFGKDGAEYKRYLSEKGVITTYAPVDESDLTSAAHIVTDQDDNQITAFYPGIARTEKSFPIADIAEKAELAFISPTRKDIMLRHARECEEENIPIVLDLGQRLTDFTEDDLQELISQASIFISNDYELKMASDKSGWDPEKILEETGILITTLGKEGSRITTKDGEVIEVPTGVPKKLVDPTGAGDAYRAGFFSAYVKGIGLKECAQAGSAAAVFAVEQHGTQNPSFSLESFRERYREIYEEEAPL